MKTLLVINSDGTYESATNSNLVIQTEIGYDKPEELIKDFVELLDLARIQFNANQSYVRINSVEDYFNYLFTVEGHEFTESELFEANGYEFYINSIPDRVICVDGLVWCLDDEDESSLDIRVIE